VCHKGPRLKPWLPRLTDRELLRASPIPVLLVKSARPWRKRAVLAAIDPSHAHAKPSRLDSRILAQGRLIAAALRAPLHVMHANFPILFGLALGDPAIDAPMFAATYEQLQARARRDFAAFAERAHIPRARRHLVDALPARGISQVARRLGADLVVMGAVSRSGLKRIFIGNTAERVLKDLPCDVLVVKPARFQKRVRGQARGMRVVAPAADAGPIAPGRHSVVP
jgi:universal stress protein E